ncbi:MAG: magnesium/cobalt transporter CorA [Bacteroidetes bacterium]|nr:magnesium/cobalt transporter CorA [Bacteroidota bacterium]
MARRKRKKIGLAPGSLVFTGEKYLDATLLHFCKYNEAFFHENREAEKISGKRENDKLYWYDMRGIHDKDLIETIGQVFEIHNLVLEDILDPQQRPKFEEYDNGLFIILQALSFDSEELKLKTEQVGIYVGDGFLWSFQEKDTDLFMHVRNRLATENSRLRKRGIDYLAYALMDALVDNYFLVLDDIESAIEQLEHAILKNPDSNTKAKIHQLKLQGVWMRKNVSPLREAVGLFSRSDHSLVTHEISIFIRDLHDHIVQVLDLTETYRDVISGLYDLYQSELSMKMNNIMQTLTIISTIFIPLGFLAGVYGMNFEQMPELKSSYGYFIWWGVVVLLVLMMLYIFRRRKWL